MIRRQKLGVSLMVLVITILVMVILAGIVIINLQEDNPIQKAREAVYIKDSTLFKDELALEVSKASKNLLYKKEDINANGYEEMKKYIPDFKKKYQKMFIIKNSQLLFNTKEAKDKKMQKVLYENGFYPQYSDRNEIYKVGPVIKDTILGMPDPNDKKGPTDIALYIGGQRTFKNVLFLPGNGEDSYFISINQTENPVQQLIFENCEFKGNCKLANHNMFINVIFRNCKFENVNLDARIDDRYDAIQNVTFENCEMYCKDKNFINTAPFAYSKGKINVIFKNCIINTKGNKDFISMYAPPTSGQIHFINTRINSDYALIGGHNKGYKYKFDIILENSSGLPTLLDEYKDRVTVINR